MTNHEVLVLASRTPVLRFFVTQSLMPTLVRIVDILVSLIVSPQFHALNSVCLRTIQVPWLPVYANIAPHP